MHLPLPPLTNQQNVDERLWKTTIMIFEEGEKTQVYIYITKRKIKISFLLCNLIFGGKRDGSLTRTSGKDVSNLVGALALDVKVDGDISQSATGTVKLSLGTVYLLDGTTDSFGGIGAASGDAIRAGKKRELE